jgi:carbohydrate-selective porin OprB
MIRYFLPGVLALVLVNPSRTEGTEPLRFLKEPLKQKTYTDSGIDIEIGMTGIYQQNVNGGLSTHRRAGRNSGSYDMEISMDLEKILGMKNSSLFVHTEGFWSKSAGIDGPSVGSFFGVNADAVPRDSVVVTELWFERAMFDGKFLLRIGKMDLTGGFECGDWPVAFDAGAFANDETSQFLNSALVNNPTIPFPIYALGLAGYYNPMEWWYLSAGVVDAQNDLRETGLRTTFYGEDYFFYIFETGVTPVMDSSNGPLQGAYRIGLWNDPQPKAHSDAMKTYRDDVGLYLSCDQMLYKESSGDNDSQGLGAFARYGYADGDKNDMTNFRSFGIQYQGLLDGRDEDVLGAGFAQGFFSDKASITYAEDYESAFEFYYSARLEPCLNISPSIQYITNTGGSGTTEDSVVLSVRVQMFF